jgi:two-component system KDP operon response regulator KdpE
MTSAQVMTALLIEDEKEIRRLLRRVLPNYGYRLVEAATGRDGLEKLTENMPDFVLLDLGLPDCDGMEIIRKMRKWTSVPIIVLSARDREQVKVKSLDNGADDYLTKPFSLNELLARMRRVIRYRDNPPGKSNNPVFVTGDLKVDFSRRLIFLSNKEVHLSRIEFKLLAALIRSAERVLTHRQLLSEIWGPLYTEESQYLRVYMRQLRHKLEVNPANPRYLITEMGVGYRLRVV